MNSRISLLLLVSLFLSFFQPFFYFIFSQASAAEMTVNFEWAWETDWSYAVATVNLSWYDWQVWPQALIGTAGGDIKNWDRAARIRFDSWEYWELRLLENKIWGIGQVSFFASRANFSWDRSWVAPVFELQYSSEAPWDTWTTAGSVDLAWVNSLTEYTFNVNYSWDTGRVRFIQTWGDAGKRWNLDDITIGNYNTYTVQFLDFDGTVLVTQTIAHGDDATAPTDPTRTGYTFTGWNPATLTNITADSDFIAQYSINSYTLTFDSDGGSAVDPITQDFDTALPVVTDPTRAGYTFNGWSPALPTTMPATNQTHTASWNAITYDIVFNPNEGTGTIPNQTLTYDSPTNLTENTFTRTGWTFAWWNTSADGSGTSYSNAQSVENLSTTQGDEITLYAQWTQDDITPPTISNPQGNTLSIRRNRDLTLTPTCSDNVDPSCTPTFSGSIIDPTTWVVDTSAAGTYTVEIIATDAAGNTSTETVTITIRSSWGGGWGWTPFVPNLVDNCPGWDFSWNLFDGSCEAPTQDEDANNNNENENNNQTGENNENESSTEDTTEQSNDENTTKEESLENNEDTQDISISDESLLFADDSIQNTPSSIQMTREVQWVTKTYTLQNTFSSCSIIDALNNPNYPYEQDIFTDIELSVYKNSIEKFHTLNLVHGTQAGLFEPTRQITRAEFTKLVLLSHCYQYQDEDTSSPIFTDLTPDTWETRVAHKAKDLEIIHWYQDGTFKPQELITKAEALKILLRMAYIQTQDTDPLGYTDIETEWHKSYIEVAQTLWIFNPTQDNFIFRPNAWVQRDEMVDMIERIVKLYR